MIYSADVKHFWFICKVLFKEKCLTFFRGESNRLNFPVPRIYDNTGQEIPDRMEPGLLEPMLSAYQGGSKDNSFNLSCDLKGINPSKIDPMGGVDLAGFEPSPTKIELSDRVASEISTLDEGIAQGDTALNEQGLESLKERLANVFRETIVIASRRIKDLRDYVAGKGFAVGKLLARAGEKKVNDWTKTKYVLILMILLWLYMAIIILLHTWYIYICMENFDFKT